VSQPKARRRRRVRRSLRTKWLFAPPLRYIISILKKEQPMTMTRIQLEEEFDLEEIRRRFGK
jgi:hypothetical protein